MSVPFNDLNLYHNAIAAKLRDCFDRVLASGQLAGGSHVESFESAFAAYCGSKRAIGLASGTDALWLALKACGIGSGDEVITSPCTFIATSEAIELAGATPVFVDVDPATYTLDPSRIEAAVTARTKAIIPVHIFGQMADMDPIMEIARRHGLRVIEDAAQAQGATYKGRHAGTIGDIGCFSFYPGKNLGALGDAGAAVTDDPQLADRMQRFRNHGQVQQYEHAQLGWNARMDGIQAACLEAKLPDLDERNERRRQAAQLYRSILGDVAEITLPHAAEQRSHIYHIFAIRVPHRDRLRALLGKRGIDCRVHYPVPTHLEPAFAGKHRKSGSLSIAENCAASFLSLPLFPEITEGQVSEVAIALRACLAELASEANPIPIQPQTPVTAR